MHLKSKTDYSLRVLIYLQQNPGRIKIQEIADRYHISKNHLNVVVNQLSDLGYIDSKQGPKGGIEINPKAMDKTVGELVLKIDEFNIVECFNSKTNSCVLDPSCKLKIMISRATSSFLHELMKYKLSDLV